jgi:hypothetical protein
MLESSPSPYQFEYPVPVPTNTVVQSLFFSMRWFSPVPVLTSAGVQSLSACVGSTPVEQIIWVLGWLLKKLKKYLSDHSTEISHLSHCAYSYFIWFCHFEDLGALNNLFLNQFVEIIFHRDQ